MKVIYVSQFYIYTLGGTFFAAREGQNGEHDMEKNVAARLK